jgi:hypothetical protein
MHLSRLMAFSLMVPALAIPAVAQSSPSGPPGAAAPLFSAPNPKADSRGRLPALSAKPRITYGFGHGLGEAQDMGSAVLPMQQRQFKLNMQKLKQLSPLLNRDTFEIASAGAGAGIRPGQARGGCYTMRSYRFERDAPGSDATSFKESYSCALAAQFQAKSIVGPLMIQPVAPVH